MKLKCASFFGGVGGIELGFERSIFEIVYTNEIDANAIRTYENNFNIKVDFRDIRKVLTTEIPDFDIMFAGFPCQPFSIAGHRHGFNDKKNRGNLFFELTRIIKDKQPGIIFLENVKNLVSHDNGKTFRTIIEHLENLNYHIKFKILNAKDYANITHNRERIYIVGFKDINQYYKFDFPEPIKLTSKITDFINFDDDVDTKYIYSEKNCSFYNQLLENMNNSKSIYQWRRVYLRENKNNVCPTLTANMGTGGHNVPLIVKFKSDGSKLIRKLTPRECFNLQGFPSDYNLPEISNSHLYKQAGNSVVVSLIKRIADKIISVL